MGEEQFSTFDVAQPRKQRLHTELQLQKPQDKNKKHAHHNVIQEKHITAVFLQNKRFFYICQ
jgi:hypothetical protein